MNIIKGDLIALAKAGEFDVITHSCNCFCRMKRGIAPQMAKAFGCRTFHLEKKLFEGQISKLGNIDVKRIGNLWVVNSYMQYHWSKPSRFGIPFDYDACRLCLRKINAEFSVGFKDPHLGLPWIGCGLAGGSKQIVLEILLEEISNMRVTIVEFPDE